MMDWDHCIRTREAKPISPDQDMAAALRKTSMHKAFSAAQLEMREETIAAKISLSYDAVRELLEAFALLKGFKIYNHVCYASFLSTVLNQETLAEEFDILRKVRNDINYYGKAVSETEAETVLERLETLRQALRKLMEKL